MLWYNAMFFTPLLRQHRGVYHHNMIEPTPGRP